MTSLAGAFPRRLLLPPANVCKGSRPRVKVIAASHCAFPVAVRSVAERLTFRENQGLRQVSTEETVSRALATNVAADWGAAMIET